MADFLSQITSEDDGSPVEDVFPDDVYLRYQLTLRGLQISLTIWL